MKKAILKFKGLVMSIISIIVTIGAVIGYTIIVNKINIPPVVIAFPVVAIIMLFHVLTLGSDVKRNTKNEKTLAAIGFFVMAIIVLVNHFVVYIFEPNMVLMFIIAFLPAVLFSLYNVFIKKT